MSVWWNHEDVKEKPQEKARLEQHRKAAFWFEPILALTTYLTNSPDKTSKTFEVLPEKQEQTRKRHSTVDSDS